ncbi:hypothetical protein [Kibdelosporangium philippinense]|uniref:hypothetical protein n=1 Tax=Kibdelosporangium philippinense TaxID=211113 RepID=UPI00360E5D3C
MKRTVRAGTKLTQVMVCSCREFRCAGKVNTPCRNGGHGVLEWWTRCSGTVDTAI